MATTSLKHDHDMVYAGTSITYRIDGQDKDCWIPADALQSGKASGTDGITVERKETLVDKLDYLTDGELLSSVETVLNVPLGVDVISFRDMFSLKSQPEFTWVPHLAPRDGMLIGDMVFRSPAMVFATDNRSVALIPDLDHLEKTPVRLPAVMDYDRRQGEGGELYYGYTPYRVADRHVYFEQDPGATIEVQDGRLGLQYDLLTAPISKPHASLERVSRYLWDRYGSRRTPDVSKEAEAQFAPFETYSNYAYTWAFDKWNDVCWHEFEIDGKKVGSVVFIVTAEQSPNYGKEAEWREAKSIWNQAWFSSLRSAYGYYVWGQKWGRQDLIERANLSKEFALAAPQQDGLFPAWYRAGEDGSWETGGWVRSSDRKPWGHDDYYHVLDASWTALWMLRWYRDLDKDERLLTYVDTYIQRLLSLQLPSGSFPSWVHGDTGEISPFLKESPQTAMHVLLLAEWHALKKDETALEAAKRGAEYLINGPIPEGRWEDFETYWSCSREWELKQYGVKDEKSGIYAQCSFSIYWAAEALCALYEQTGDDRYLKEGTLVLGELSLYQQVWDPPFVDIPAFGGFGVMNTDGEWNDARQSLIAPTYFRYFKHTGSKEYFQRGVAALKAAFVMMYAPENKTVKSLYDARHPHFGPEDYGFSMENYAHGGVSGVDGIGPFTIFDWGCGSASATAAMIKRDYGDVYVDVERKVAHGINGCVAEWTEEGISIREVLGTARQLRVVTSEKADYDVSIDAHGIKILGV